MRPNLDDQIITITKITKTFAFSYMQDSNNWFKGYFQCVPSCPNTTYLTKLCLCYSEASLDYINPESSCLPTHVDNCTKHVHITFGIGKRLVKICV